MRRLAWAVACLVAAAPSAAQAQTASGSLSVNGSKTPLQYVYATAHPSFFDRNKEDVQVLLSDVPLSDVQRANPFELIRLGRDGQAHVVEVVIDAAGDPIMGAIYAPIFSGMLSLTGIHVFERIRFDHDAVEGRIHTRAEHEFQNIAISYDASFATTIPHAPTAAQLSAALASPPGEVAKAHLQALLAGDFQAFILTMAPAAVQEYAGPVGRERFLRFRREMPPNAVVTALTQQSESTATATLQGSDRGTVIEYSLNVERWNGRWLIGK